MKELKSFDDSGSIDIKCINSFEQKTGYAFPELYKTILSNYDALYPVQNYFDFTDPINKENNTRDIIFFGYSDQLPSCDKIENAQQDEACPGHLVVFGCSANGDYICFDYRGDVKSNNPTVVLMYHDCFDSNDLMVVCFVAKTFEDFLNILYESNI